MVIPIIGFVPAWVLFVIVLIVLGIIFKKDIIHLLLIAVAVILIWAVIKYLF